MTMRLFVVFVGKVREILAELRDMSDLGMKLNLDLLKF
jgi:hypothetical protein